MSPYDPSPDQTQTTSNQTDPTLAGMAESIHMTGKDLHKFMDNLVNSITNSIKNDTDHAVNALKEMTQNLQQASGG